VGLVKSHEPIQMEGWPERGLKHGRRNRRSKPRDHEVSNSLDRAVERGPRGKTVGGKRKKSGRANNAKQPNEVRIILQSN